MITSHYIKTYESGIIQLIINTEEKWLDYHRYSDDSYGVWDAENKEEQHLVVLPLQPKMRYIPSSFQEKNQIIYYYIPLYLIMEKDKWDKIKEKL